MKESFYTLWHLINVDCRSMLHIYVYIETKQTNTTKSHFFPFVYINRNHKNKKKLKKSYAKFGYHIIIIICVYGCLKR